jgi:hypothetical protein
VKRTVLLVFAISASGPGCSQLAVKGPTPTYDRFRPFECTTSYEAPIIDATLAVFGGTIAAVAVPGVSTNARYALFLVPFTLFGVSSAEGFKKVSDCREVLGVSGQPPPRPARRFPVPSD